MSRSNKDKTIHPARWLLLIPLQLILDIVIITLCAYLDSNLFADAAQAQGHPAPAFTMIGFILVFVLSAAAVLVAIIMFIASLIRKHSLKQQ
ncbi:MAG: hypothetical protein J6Z05_11030 [Lachnospiraceae bacterium]|nr:hypothetical protein [Lachnospiraceae bacterium]